MNLITRFSRACCAAALWLCAMTSAGRAEAQQATPATLPAGTPLQITLRGDALPLRPISGRRLSLLGADSTYLWVSGLSRTKTDTIAYLALYRLEVRDGSYERSHIIGGGVITGAAMMSVAFVVIAIARPKSLTDPTFYQTAGAVMGVGAGVGGVLAAIAPTTRWRTVHPPLVVTPAADSTVAH